jgi:hypothetical protein
MAGIALLILMSGLCWFLVFSKATRKRMPKPGWVRAVSIDRDEQRNLTDGVILVSALLMAMVFTLVSIVAIVVAIARLIT